MDTRVRRRGRLLGGFTSAAVLAAYGAVAGPSALAVPGDADCAALAAQMRALAGPRIDDTLDQWYEDGPNYAESDSQLSGLGLGNDLEGEGALAPAADPPLPDAVLEAVGTSATGTNVAERGVDEADLVKVDGTRLLRLWGFLPVGADGAGAAPPVDEWQLSVLDASGDSPRLLGSVGPAERHVAHEMFLLGEHRVVVLGSVTERSPRRGDRAATPKVVLTLIDTAELKVLRTAKVTGRYVSARMADGVVRVVLATSAPIHVSAPLGPEPRPVATSRNRAALQGYAGTDWLPAREVLDGAGKLVATGPAMACADVHRPAAPRSPDLLSVRTLDSLDGADILDRAAGSGLVGGGDTVYASTDRLYVAAGALDPADRDLEDAPVMRHDRIDVHAFDVTARRSAPHLASGEVDGWLLGRSALSEHDGLLRMAVTLNQDGGRHSRIVVLAEAAGHELREVGRVSGIGPGDDVKSVRWFGPWATVVTFRQKDPFYVVDLSAPTAPRVLGALEVPGYSGYLHPVGGGRVLGVGQDADMAGTATALQVSVFDVRDPSGPRRTANLGLGAGKATAEADPRAFTYLPDRRLALVPGWLGSTVACPQQRDPACWILVRDGQPREIPRSPHFGDHGQGVPAVTGLVVEDSGRLREIGRFLTGAPVIRVVPVGDRLAVVTWSSVVMLDPRDMKPLGALVLDGRYGVTRG